MENRNNSFENSQKGLEEYLEYSLENNNISLKDSINGMMSIEKIYGSFREKTITMVFPLQRWQVNRAGVLQGGIYATAMDICASCLARYINDTNFSPTMELSVRYLRPIKVDDKLVVEAILINRGSTMTYVEARAFSHSTKKLVATSTCGFKSEKGSKMQEKKKFQGGYIKNIINNSDRL